MKFEFIGNACGIFHGSKGTKILCDPWIVDGVFEGSWFHYPPLKTTIADLRDVDAIYLSHLHPDHYDERYFDFRKDIPIFILDEKHKFLEKKLRAKGYENLAVIPDGSTHSFNELGITLFAPFTTHPFHDAVIGNIIDSAMVIKDIDGTAAFNANDNTPTPEACERLRAMFGTIDLAMLNYNSAGPYPACFKMKSEDRRSEHHRLLLRNFDYMVELLSILKPKRILPFAGAYVIGGKLWRKNSFLGTTTWDSCIAAIEGRLPPTTKTLALRENDVFDLKSEISNRKYERINDAQMSNYIKQISKTKYPYQMDRDPNRDRIHCDLVIASSKLKERMQKLGIKTETEVTVEFGHQKVLILPGGPAKLRCKVPSRLLRRILDKKAQWNNAEIGCHIEFERSHGYEPDLHTALQFLHL